MLKPSDSQELAGLESISATNFGKSKTAASSKASGNESLSKSKVELSAIGSIPLISLLLLFVLSCEAPKALESQYFILYVSYTSLRVSLLIAISS